MGIADRQVRRADFHRFCPIAIRHSTPIARRNLDHPNLAGRPDRPLHAMVQRVGAVDPIGGWTFPAYIALYALILNLVIAIVVTPLMNTLGAKPQDQTEAADYYA